MKRENCTARMGRPSLEMTGINPGGLMVSCTERTGQQSYGRTELNAGISIIVYTETMGRLLNILGVGGHGFITDIK